MCTFDAHLKHFTVSDIRERDSPARTGLSVQFCGPLLCHLRAGLVVFCDGAGLSAFPPHVASIAPVKCFLTHVAF